MTTSHLSLRIDETTLERMDSEGRRTQRSRSEVAKTLLEEGLRMGEHPGIMFRAGPAGRRAGLMGGPDVWEVVRAFQTQPAAGEPGIHQTAEAMDLDHQAVRTALRYYAAFQSEVDAWIQRVDDEAARAEAAWHREQQALQR